MAIMSSKVMGRFHPTDEDLSVGTPGFVWANAAGRREARRAKESRDLETFMRACLGALVCFARRASVHLRGNSGVIVGDNSARTVVWRGLGGDLCKCFV